MLEMITDIVISNGSITANEGFLNLCWGFWHNYASGIFESGLTMISGVSVHYRQNINYSAAKKYLWYRNDTT